MEVESWVFAFELVTEVAERDPVSRIETGTAQLNRPRVMDFYGSFSVTPCAQGVKDQLLFAHLLVFGCLARIAPRQARVVAF